MGRRTSLATLAGDKVDKVPGESDPLLLTLPLLKLVPTRFNPRRNFGTLEELEEFGRILNKRQLQPAVVVSRTAYLKLWPEEEENVGSASYVIANGERRFRASGAVGIPTLNVVHDENVAASRADFLDAVLSENNDRKDLDPIEQALGIETMVAQLGGADPVAEHYGKTKGWVSQQRKLLKLTPELQDLVSSREMPVRVGREIAGLPAEEQGLAWAARVEQRQAAAAKPRRTPAPRREPTEPAKQPERFTAVNQNTSDTARPVPPARTEQAQPPPETTDPPAYEEENGQDSGPDPLPDLLTTGAIPWRKVPVVMATLKRLMTPEDYVLLIKEMNADLRQTQT